MYVWMRCLAVVAWSIGAAASAAGPAEEPIDSPKIYFSHDDFDNVRLSPSGERLAAVAPISGRRGLVVMDIATRKPRVASVIDGWDIFDFHWVNDDRLIFRVFNRDTALGEQRGGGLFAVDHDGSDFRELHPTIDSMLKGLQFRYRGARLMTTLDDGGDDVLIEANEHSDRYYDVYRLNTRSGRRTLLTFDRPGNGVDWTADRQGIVRAGITTEGKRQTVWWRPTGEAKWQKVGGYDLKDPNIRPIAFDGDGSLVVASNIGRDTYALYRYDTQKMALGELLAAHPQADLSRVLYDRTKKKIVGVYYDAGKPAYAWFDEDWARLAATIDKALPNTFNALSRGRGKHVLVRAVSDVDPGSWYLLDLDKKRLEFALESRKIVKPARMPPRTFVRYKARDGLEIPAYLTLPKDREAKNLPLVLLVHGGPWVRGSHWIWDDEAAYLANLGYAVLQPEFRGSLGWGAKHYYASWKQWGLAMQDDLVDGIDYLVQRGIVDPKRVCIMGGSYGGYAVMIGLARDPDRFRCGVNIVGVTDITMMFTVAWSDMADSDFMRHGTANEMIGDPDRDADQLKRTSPLANAAKIKVPVLMAYGGGDYRVPIVHGVRMRDALLANGTPVEWIEYAQEGHGFLLEENRFDFYDRVAKFLARQLSAK